MSVGRVSVYTGWRLPWTRGGAQRQSCQALLSVLLTAVSALMFLVTLVKTILQNMKLVNELHEDTCQCMEQRSVLLSQQMARMLGELEHKAVGQTGGSWGPVLWAALPQWHFWAIAGALLLLVALCWQLRKRGFEVLPSW